MQETKEFVEKISPRLSKVRNERLNFLWSDFLGAVEKVINILTDEQLAATTTISILYKIKDNDERVYRSNFAELNCSDDERIEYEEKDVCLGTKGMLERPFRDFRKKAEQDTYCDVEWFSIKYLFECDTFQEVHLDFDICKIDIGLNKKSSGKYKIIVE